MLGRQAVHALKALLELAEAPQRWRSVRELADRLGLPAPMLEQLLLRLRRAGLLEARRGRLGGYRLARAAAAIPLAEVLQAIGSSPATAAVAEPPAGLSGEGAVDAASLPAEAGERVAALLESRLRRALARELERCSLAELLHDLRSARAVLSEEGGLLLG